MIKTIDNQNYDTDSAELVARKTSGWYGDPYGFEELLFRKGQEAFFLLGQGGSSSIYHEPAIVPLSLQDAREWLNGVVGPDVSWQICEPVALWNEEASRQAAEAPVKAKAKPTSGRTGKAGAGKASAGKASAGKASAAKSGASKVGSGKSARTGGKSAKSADNAQPDREPVLAGTETRG